MKINLSNIIAPSFYDLHVDIKHNRHTEYMLKGGRGSTKSSFVGIEIVLGMMRDAAIGEITNAVGIRKVKDTLKDSVFEQIAWAIDILGVGHLWNIPLTKLEITYLPTGQKILFRGADSPKKIKSTKVSRGYIKYIWYEELDELYGPEEVRSINQSLMRGGETFVVFYTYNPPKSSRSWVNQEAKIKKPGRLVHHSDYRDVPEEWLGKVFITEAEHLKRVNNDAYRHEYLGEEVGTGLEVFTNINLREITLAEINQFAQIRQGLDFGYAADPVAFNRLNYDKTRRKIYIFHEYSGLQISNRKLFDNIKNYGHFLTIADSAEPKSIAELKSYGMKIKGAKKGPDSIEYGIKFLSEEIEEIIIDPQRCPRAAKEFVNYSLETDRNGEVKSTYPDKDNHTIDDVRYALNDDISFNKVKVNTFKGGL